MSRDLEGVLGREPSRQKHFQSKDPVVWWSEPSLFKEQQRGKAASRGVRKWEVVGRRCGPRGDGDPIK